MSYDYETQCHINEAGFVLACGHPTKVPGCTACQYHGCHISQVYEELGVVEELQRQDKRRQTNEAFNLAIKWGWLSEDPRSNLFAGHYLYMGLNQEGLPVFQHEDTKEFLSV